MAQIYKAAGGALHGAANIAEAVTLVIENYGYRQVAARSDGGVTTFNGEPFVEARLLMDDAEAVLVLMDAAEDDLTFPVNKTGGGTQNIVLPNVKYGTSELKIGAPGEQPQVAEGGLRVNQTVVDTDTILTLMDIDDVV